MNRTRDEYLRRRLYRNPERAVILGVCAGMAEYSGCPTWLTRGGSIALGWFFPIAVVFAYGVAALILPTRPLRFCGEGDERSFWQSGNRAATGGDR
ncbi:MAG: PspC domain-containing protein [Rudaea sp.]